MPLSCPQMLDRLLGALSRTSALMSAAEAAEDEVLAKTRVRQAREDLDKRMPLVRKIKSKRNGAQLNERNGAVATGSYAKAVVFAGRKEKTPQNQTKSDLMKNRKGKVVSKAASAAGEQKKKYLYEWSRAVQRARHDLGIVGFCPVGGKTPQGKRLMKKARYLCGRC